VNLEQGLQLAVAGLVGLAVGIEREWSGHSVGPNARFAGARTFLLLGLIGGLSGLVIQGGFVVAGVTLLAGGIVMSIVAYLMAARREEDQGGVEGTTEVAALVVLGLGLAATLGYVAVASAVTAVVVLALREKSTIQGFVNRIGEPELRGAFQFAVMALVVLPLVPTGPVGPLDSIRPRTVWTIVLIFSGLNYLGYLARRILGQKRGLAVAGALGGLVSSTAVAVTFGRRSREEPEQSSALALGVVAASMVLVPRVLGIAWVLNPPLGNVLLVGLIPSLVLAVGVLVLIRRHASGQEDTSDPPTIDNPLQIGSAIRMALVFQAAMIALDLASTRFGVIGVQGSAALLGLTSMDALTFSMSRFGEAEISRQVAAQAILVGIASSSLLKLVAVIVLGSPKFRRASGLGLGALAVTAGIGWWLLAR
jgi:uncharacterized membrane protein (DUF4010 family)